MSKAASFGDKIGGAALAEEYGVTAPLWLTAKSHDPAVLAQLKVAQALCEAEDEIKPGKPIVLAQAFQPIVQPPAADMPAVCGNLHKLAQAMTALAAQQCMLPVSAFLSLITGDSLEKVAAVAAQVQARLPGVYNRLAGDPQLEAQLAAGWYNAAADAPASTCQWAYKQANAWAIDRAHVTQRLQLAALRAPDLVPVGKSLCKVATAMQQDALARDYALYQIALLTRLADKPDHEFRVAAAIAANCAC
jgi:hypothetical protein